jgi:hypothetical protein
VKISKRSITGRLGIASRVEILNIIDRTVSITMTVTPKGRLGFSVGIVFPYGVAALFVLCVRLLAIDQ